MTSLIQLTGDIFDNNIVDISDNNRMVENFGCEPGVSPVGKDCTEVDADLDFDNDVDIFDYAYLVGNFGETGDSF